MLKRLIVIFFLVNINFYFFSIEEKYLSKIDELNYELVKNGIPDNWMLENIQDDRFEIYENMANLNNTMPENQVRHKEKDFEWYKNQFGIDEKISLGKKFIDSNKDILLKAEAVNGIHYELIVAILGMETNYGDSRFTGKFYVFPSLISQYIFFPKKKDIL